MIICYYRCCCRRWHDAEESAQWGMYMAALHQPRPLMAANEVARAGIDSYFGSMKSSSASNYGRLV